MSSPGKRRFKGLKRLAQAAVGVAVGLAVAEGVFWARDGGAFPHLNCYVADPTLGVRLLPGATERVQFGGSAVTSVRINSDGLRGPELGPPPGEGESDAVVVGDSQVFGLGVDEGETMSAALARRLKAPVVNAGVPTYGPPEYNAQVSEVLAKRKAKTVVYVINVVNDFFEATRPNLERHAVWDGWAVRKETAPTKVRSFPGRELLYRRSHLFYGLRRYLYRASAPAIDDRGGYPSEGTARDLVGQAADLTTAQARAKDEAARRAALHRLELRFAETSTAAAEIAVEELISRKLLADGGTTELNGVAVGPGVTYRAARANPGDIVAPAWGEEGRDTIATARLISEGAKLRERFEAEVRARAASDPSFANIVKVLEERDGLKARLVKTRAAPVGVVRARSPIAQQIARAKEICDKHGARLVVVGLPMDIMVFPSAFAKYGSAPLDLSAIQVLMRDIVEAAKDLGAIGVDATPALRAAGEDAFLPREFHLTPKGHEAVAAAIAEALAQKPPKPAPRGLPEGRSPLPMPEEWAVREVTVHGSDAAGCVTKRVREYFSIRCGGVKAGGRPAPLGVTLVKGGGGDAVTALRDGIATLIAPVMPGEELTADFFFPGGTQRLVIPWPQGEAVPDGRLEPKRPPEPPPAVREPPELCACYQQVTKATSCAEFIGAADPGCARTYAGNCQAMVACALGDEGRPPACEEGEANVGATHRCRALCGDDKPCASGACTAYQGGHVCLAP